VFERAKFAALIVEAGRMQWEWMAVTSVSLCAFRGEIRGIPPHWRSRLVIPDTQYATRNEQSAIRNSTGCELQIASCPHWSPAADGDFTISTGHEQNTDT
jgi:hypothetical protein